MTTEEFQKSGLLWLANRAIHPFGIALAVTVDEHGAYDEGVALISTNDPVGFVFDDEQERSGRQRLAAWIRENWKP